MLLNALDVQVQDHRDTGDQQWKSPTQKKKLGHPAGRHPVVVPQGVTHGEVAVKGDAAEVIDGGGAESDIQDGVDLAEDLPELPAVNGPDQAEGHHQYSHQKVRHSQRQEKGVSGSLKFFKVSNGDYYQ